MADYGDNDEGIELEESHKPFCPKCGSTDIRGSHAHHALDYLLRTFGRQPYRCRSCRRRFYLRKPADPEQAPPPESDADRAQDSPVEQTPPAPPAG